MNSATPTTYVDGSQIFQRAESVNPPRFVYPFRQNGDIVTAYFEEDFWQMESTYVPVALGTQHPVLRDYYLVQESPPVSVTANVFQFTRLWSRIPTTQYVYSSMAITKPVAPNQNTGGTLTTLQQDSSSDTPSGIGESSYYNGYIFPANNTVYGILKSSTRTAPVVATGGTFTVTYKTSTTGALAYNATCVAVAAAINALADVVSDGLTVNVNGGVGNMWDSLTTQSVNITAGSTTSRFTVNAASLTGVTAAKCFTAITNSTSQNLQLAYKFAVASHGWAGTENLLLAESTAATAAGTIKIVLPTVSWSVIDANNIAVIGSLTGVDGAIGSAYITGSLLGAYLRSYTPGPDRVSVRLASYFYLPGVTTGITTPADIPIPQPLINDADFLAAVLANTSGFLNYDSDSLVFWMGTTIYTQTQKQINMADV